MVFLLLKTKGTGLCQCIQMESFEQFFSMKLTNIETFLLSEHLNFTHYLYFDKFLQQN